MLFQIHNRVVAIKYNTCNQDWNKCILCQSKAIEWECLPALSLENVVFTISCRCKHFCFVQKKLKWRFWVTASCCCVILNQSCDFDAPVHPSTPEGSFSYNNYCYVFNFQSVFWGHSFYANIIFNADSFSSVMFSFLQLLLMFWHVGKVFIEGDSQSTISI